MREQAALSNAPEGYLDFHDEYAELIAELAALGFTPTQVLRRLNFSVPAHQQEAPELCAGLRHLAVWPGHGRRPELHGARMRPLVRFRGSLRSASGARVRGADS